MADKTFLKMKMLKRYEKPQAVIKSIGQNLFLMVSGGLNDEPTNKPVDPNEQLAKPSNLFENPWEDILF